VTTDRERPETGSPLVELTLARLREFIRDPGAVFWTFGFPIVLAVALGIAFRETPPPSSHVAIDAAAPDAAEIALALDADAAIVATTMVQSQAARSLATGKIDLFVVPGDPVTYRYDSMRPEANTARLAVDAAIQRAAGRVDPLAATDDVRTEVGGRYIDFLVPGLIGLNIMGSAIWGIGFAVVDARRRKLLKRLAATPMSRAHFLLSFMMSRLVFLAGEVIALVGFGWLVFDVPVRGSLFVLAIVSTWGALTLTGIAMLLAARPKSTEVASGFANLFMLPMWLLGGSFFSYERFPEAALPVIRALPLAALNDALRKVMNEGLGLVDVAFEMTALGLWGALAFVIALRWFRWQ
jgi:ABC-type multidrug transport system permease subunit